MNLFTIALATTLALTSFGSLDATTTSSTTSAVTSPVQSGPEPVPCAPGSICK